MSRNKLMWSLLLLFALGLSAVRADEALPPATALIPADAVAICPDERTCESAGSANWFDRVQTYSMLPLFADDAKGLNVTVNGLWAGIGGTDAILPHGEHAPAVRRKYAENAAVFASDMHQAGLRVCAAVNGLEGMASLRDVVPNLDAMACRSADGSVAMVGDGMTLMCTNNPAWVRWEIDRGKKAIDDGADLILVDTPMSSSFVSGFLGAGWCEHCMATFKLHLASKYSAEKLRDRFELDGFDNAAVSRRLSPLQQLTSITDSPHVRNDPTSRLFREFIAAQEAASYRTRRQLFDELRAHAQARGADVAFTTNAADLGTQNPGGHWIRAIMFADMVDFFAYELNADPNGAFGTPLVPLPRGKWAAYHKLAYAIHGRRSAAVIHAGNMGQLLKQVIVDQKSINTWMGTQVAEAYAANGAYTIYQIGVPGAQQLLRSKCWDRAAACNQFVLQHGDLYDGELRSGSSVCFLFLFNDRGRTVPAVFPSYLGLAQGFVETNRPFDVVFAGDGTYVKDRLDAADLEAFTVIIVPSPIRPTENQRRTVRQFAVDGGVVVCQEPELLGLTGDSAVLPAEANSWWSSRFSLGKGTVFVLAGDVTPTETTDIGTRFFREYSEDLRSAIGTMAAELGIPSIIDGHADGLLSAFLVRKPHTKQVVVHLVNCDIDHELDAIRPKQDVRLTLPRPDFFTQPPQGIVHHFAGGDADVLMSVDHDTVRVQIPTVNEAATVVLTASDEGPIR